MTFSFLKAAFTIFKQKFFSSKLYSKNMLLLFIAVFLFALGIFSHTRIKNFSYRVKNNYVRDILISLSRPFCDFARNLPFEKLFIESRKKLLLALNLEDDYHWDNFYYNEKPFSFLNTQKTKTLEEEKSTEQNSTHIALAPKIGENADEFTIHSSNNKSKKSEGTLLLANFDYSRENPLRILFAGDSQMQSLSEGFKRNIGDNSPFVAQCLAVVSSGFVRDDYYNWPAKLTSLFNEAKRKAKPFDAVVLILGMNDYQNFFDGNGRLFKKGSSDWERAYIQKIKSLMDILQANVKKIYWLGLPLLRSPRLNEEISFVENCQIKALNQLDKAKVERISLRSLLATKAATYTDRLTLADGKSIVFMRNDGMHYTLAGGSFIMSEVEKYFYRDFYIEK